MERKGVHDMGRTSKRTYVSGTTKAMAPETGQGKQQGVNHYKAGIYARLSSDQDLKKNESVETQIEIAKRYVEDWNQRHKDKIDRKSVV